MSEEPQENPDVVAAWPEPIDDSHAEPVLVFTASTMEEAEVVRASLQAAGIPAFLNHDSTDPVVGALDPAMGTPWAEGVFVAPSNVEAARAILNAPPLTEEELSAEADADTTTLAEAENRAKLS